MNREELAFKLAYLTKPSKTKIGFFEIIINKIFYFLNYK